MEIEIRYKYYVMVFLLEECNFSCSHCTRIDEPMEPGYRLSFEQHQMFLSDCRKLASVRWVEHSGGETTLWKDGNRDLVDVLIEESKAGLYPGFTTNGSLFVDYALCHNFFQKYFSTASMPLRAYLSIDIFHNNFDTVRGRALSLDNVLKYRDNLPSHKQDMLTIIPLTVVSKDPTSLLPDEMLRHYESLGVPFRILPLGLRGKAKKSLAHLCPDLTSDKPVDLGAYYPFRTTEPQKENRAPNLVLIGENYYLSEPEWRVVGRLGFLPDEIITAFTEQDKG